VNTSEVIQPSHEETTQKNFEVSLISVSLATVTFVLFSLLHSLPYVSLFGIYSFAINPNTHIEAACCQSVIALLWLRKKSWKFPWKNPKFPTYSCVSRLMVRRVKNMFLHVLTCHRLHYWSYQLIQMCSSASSAFPFGHNKCVRRHFDWSCHRCKCDDLNNCKRSYSLKTNCRFTI
jgi:hypothetical protein